MKLIAVTIFILTFYLNGFSQVRFPIEMRVEKQAMSTPMSPLDEAFFTNYYYSRPVNIKFDGSLIDMFFDNGTPFQKINVTKVKQDSEIEKNRVLSETIFFTDNNNVSDTISLVIDHQFGFVQFILPTKSSKGEYWGYTSYRQFIDLGELALK